MSDVWTEQRSGSSVRTAAWRGVRSGRRGRYPGGSAASNSISLTRSARPNVGRAEGAASTYLSTVLARRHYSGVKAYAMSTKVPNLSLLDDVVAPKVIDAMNVASAQLKRVGVRHLLVGGLAVGAYGHPRATKDVDFLVADDAFEVHGGGIVTMKPGVPIQVGKVAIDHLSAEASEDHLRREVDAVDLGASTPTVAPIEVLVYLKLKSPRAQDRADLIELVKAGIDVAGCRDYLARNGPHLSERFEAAVQDAAREEQL
jgi:hypothetical protein